MGGSYSAEIRCDSARILGEGKYRFTPSLDVQKLGSIPVLRGVASSLRLASGPFPARRRSQ
jgi:hypothetical protein